MVKRIDIKMLKSACTIIYVYKYLKGVTNICTSNLLKVAFIHAVVFTNINSPVQFLHFFFSNNEIILTDILYSQNFVLT